MFRLIIQCGTLATAKSKPAGGRASTHERARGTTACGHIYITVARLRPGETTHAKEP